VLKAEDVVVEDEVSVVVERAEGAVLPAVLLIFELSLYSHKSLRRHEFSKPRLCPFSISPKLENDMGLLSISDVVPVFCSSATMFGEMSFPPKAFCACRGVAGFRSCFTSVWHELVVETIG
jgi:hypothetical protein